MRAYAKSKVSFFFSSLTVTLRSKYIYVYKRKDHKVPLNLLVYIILLKEEGFFTDDLVPFIFPSSILMSRLPTRAEDEQCWTRQLTRKCSSYKAPSAGRVPRSLWPLRDNSLRDPWNLIEKIYKFSLSYFSKLSVMLSIYFCLEKILLKLFFYSRFCQTIKKRGKEKKRWSELPWTAQSIKICFFYLYIYMAEDDV